MEKELTKIMPGYPCHKYILRNIKTEQDLWVYAKSFVNTIMLQGASGEMVMSMLTASLTYLPSDSGIKCPDFSHIGNNIDDSCAMLMNYSGVSSFKSCSAYYKKYDSKTPCCRICPNSNIYYNDNASVELSIVKYMFSSEERFNFVTDYIDAGYFRSAIDICMEIPYVKGCVVPVLHELVKSALKENIRIILFDSGSSIYYNDASSPFDIAWNDMISRIPRERRVPSSIKNNPMWSTVLKSTIIESIQSAKDITEEDMRDIFYDYLQTSVEDTPKKTYAKSVPSWEPVFLTDIISSPSDSSELGEKDVSKNLSITDDSAGSLDILERDSVPESGPDEINILEKTPDNSLFDLNQDSSFLSNELAEATADADVIEPDPESGTNLLHMKRNMIMHVTVSHDNLTKWCNHIAANDTLSDDMYQGILRDKHLYIEVIFIVSETARCYGYLIYSVHTKKFYWSYCNNVCKQLAALLSRRMIKKVCHTPYLLYGVAKLFSYPVKNVLSIQTVHTRVSGKTAVMNYENLINTYLTDDTIPTVSSRTGPDCIFYYGVPYYEKIVKILENMLDYYEKPLLYEMDMCVDEAVGCSYLYELNFYDAGFSTILLSDGSFLYLEEFNHSPKVNGYYVNYVVADYQNSVSFFRYLLYKLSYDGHMRKCNIQLIGLHDNFINFFIAEDFFCYLSTLINIYTFDYGLLYPGRSMNIEQITEFVKAVPELSQNS